MKYLDEQAVSPRNDDINGVDYGRDGKVLAVRGHLSLVWQPGGCYWSGMNGTLYAPTTLSIRGIPGQRIGSTLHEGGRLSKALIALNSTAINRIFGEGCAQSISTKKTLILDSE